MQRGLQNRVPAIRHRPAEARRVPDGAQGPYEAGSSRRERRWARFSAALVAILYNEARTELRPSKPALLFGNVEVETWDGPITGATWFSALGAWATQDALGLRFG